MPREVWCSCCGAIVEDDALKPEEERTPCPVCKGLDRLVPVGEILEDYWTAEPNEPKEARFGSAHVTGAGVVTASGSKTEVLTFIEFPLPINSRFELRIASAEGSLLIEVSKDGEVLGAGLGDDIVEALLSMLPYMLPPDHPEYPRPS